MMDANQLSLIRLDIGFGTQETFIVWLSEVCFFFLNLVTVTGSLYFPSKSTMWIRGRALLLFAEAWVSLCCPTSKLAGA